MAFNQLKRKQKGGTTSVAAPFLKPTPEQQASALARSGKQAARDNAYRQAVLNERRANIASSQDANHNPFDPQAWTAEEFAKATKGTGDRFRLFPNSVGGAGEAFDNYVNPMVWLGNAASEVGQSMKESQESHSFKPLAKALAYPLAAGAAGIDPFSMFKTAGSIVGSRFKGSGKQLLEFVKGTAVDDTKDKFIEGTNASFQQGGPVFNKDMYKAFGDKAYSAFQEGWMPRNSTANGSTTFYNRYGLLNSVAIPTDTRKGHLALVGHDNGTFDILTQDADGKQFGEYIQRNASYDQAHQYFTNDASPIKKRADSIIDNTYAKTTYKQGGYSTTGYKKDSPHKDRPYNIIPSGRITMQDVNHPVFGMDNLGFTQLMHPGGEYQFPGNQVTELPVKQQGGSTDLSYMPLFANSIMTALSRRVEDNRQQGYQQQNLANPLNYLPMLQGQTDQELHGISSFQEGGQTTEDDDPDFMGDDWLWEPDEQPTTPPATEPTPEPAPQEEQPQDDPEIPIADQSIWDDLNDPNMPTPPAAYYSNDNSQNFGRVFRDSSAQYPARLSGNSAAIRNNNPGNIKFGDFAAKFGATDGGLAADGDGTHHAKFPTVEAGINAMGALLQGKGYANLPVYNALNRWITGSPDKPGAYAKEVANKVGNKRIADLTPEELRTVIHGMIKGEDVNMAKQLGI